MVKTEGGKGSAGSARSRDTVSKLCPYSISPYDIEQVQDVAEIESELLLIATSKVSFLEGEYKKISEKLVGLKFNMDDRRSTAKEDGDKVLELEAQLAGAAKAVLEHEMQAIGISVSAVEHEQFQKNLGVLRDNKDALEKKLDVCRSVAEVSRERAMKGEDLYQDLEIEQFKAESDLQVLRREICEMKRHSAAVEEQCVEMKKRSGLSLWPKPALHPAMANDLDFDSPTLHLHPCVFCNRGYPYYDIVIASCRHIYHIFCASALAKVENRCTKCLEVFHPHWWQNFGFRGVYAGFEDENNRLELPAKHAELKQSLREEGSLPVLNRSRSSLKHSDWGSSGSIPRSCDPVSGGTSTTTTRLHLQHTLSSSIHVPEQETLDVGPTILNPRGEEVDSPVKPDEVQHFTIDCQDVSAKLLNATVPEAMHDVADVESLEINMNPGTALVDEGIESDKSQPSSESEHFDIPKMRHSLLKRASDLPFDDGERRKKVALTSIGEENAIMLGDRGPTVESDGEGRPQTRSLNSAHGKGKGKTKNSRAKASEQLPSLSVNKVATRFGTKKS